MKMVKVDAQMRASIVSEKANGLSAHFERLRTGSPPTQRTPLHRNLTQEEVFSRWLKQLDSIRDVHPALVEYEHSRLEKTGPQGETPPLLELLDANVKLYFDRVRPAKIREMSIYPELVSRVRRGLFGDAHSLRPMSYSKVIRRSRDKNGLNTNSGLPDFSKRSRQDVQDRAILDAQSGNWKKYPAILGTRSSRGKARSIFMFPLAANLVEQSFVNVLMDVIRHRRVPSFAAWEGFDEVELSFMSQRTFTAKTLVSMDYTGMDQTMGPDQLEIVYDVIAPLFQPQYRGLLRESLLHVTSIPIMISNNTILVGTHGLASGSGWTNFSESIISEMVQTLINEKIPLVGRQLLGDDGVFSTDETDTNKIKEVIEETSALFGLEANFEKQRVDSNNFVYLQRFFDKRYIHYEGTTPVVSGVYPSVYALNAGMNPERFHDPKHWSARMEILRWIMILENTKRHPLFQQLIEFMAKGDKYDLGRKIPGFFKKVLPQDYEDAKALPNFVPSYNQASIERGINDFEVVKYLRRK